MSLLWVIATEKYFLRLYDNIKMFGIVEAICSIFEIFQKNNQYSMVDNRLD